jgi:hypothetical protein
MIKKLVMIRVTEVIAISKRNTEHLLGLLVKVRENSNNYNNTHVEIYSTTMQ